MESIVIIVVKNAKFLQGLFQGQPRYLAKKLDTRIVYGQIPWQQIYPVN